MNVCDTKYVRPAEIHVNAANKRLDGEEFGFITALYPAGHDGPPHTPKQHVMYVCKCTCGVEFLARAYALRQGTITSCGKCGEPLADRTMRCMKYLPVEGEEPEETEEVVSEEIVSEDDVLDAVGIPEEVVEEAPLDAEMRVLKTCVMAIDSLDDNTRRRRVIRYLMDMDH